MSEVLGHAMVVKVAIGMAQESFEELMKYDRAYAEYKLRKENLGLTDKQLRKAYVERMAPFFLQSARTTLAGMLTGNLSPELKDQISDALIKDHAFQAHRTF